MAFQNLCPPALIYLIFSVTQVVIDTVKGLYNTALIKIWVAFIFTILLNYLCQLGLGIISWFIVFIPFLLMTLVVAILLLMFGLDPATGKLKIKGGGNNKHNHHHHKHGPHHNHNHGHHPPPARDDKELKPADDDVMKYYDSADSGAGGGISSSDKDTEETPNEKANRILSKSLLFYTEEESDEPVTKVKEDKEHLDTTKYKLFVDTVSSILSGMGESEMASDLQTKSNACINSAKKMKKEEAKKSIESCQQGLMQAIYNKFTPQKAQQLKKNIRDMNCKDNEPDLSCQKRVRQGWWN